MEKQGGWDAEQLAEKQGRPGPWLNRGLAWRAVHASLGSGASPCWMDGWKEA